MGALPLPLPLPPVTTPGGWDPTQDVPGHAPGGPPGNIADGPTLGQVWHSIKEAAGTSVDSRTEPRVESSDTDCSQTRNQNDCNACKLAQGFLVPANYTIPLKQYRDFDYQLRIANHLAGPEVFTYTYGGTGLDRARLRLTGRKGKNEITVTEWNHGGIRFDGFWRSRCTVVEAKGHYKQFFDEEGKLHRWASSSRPTVLESWARQLNSQRRHIQSLGKPAKLEWHFLEAECFSAAQKSFRAFSSHLRHTP
ncbi:Tox-REase-5 domain-containing protein [Stenotrophomonas forensis]